MRSIALKLQQFSTRATSRPEPKPARSDLSTSLTLAAMSLSYSVVLRLGSRLTADGISSVVLMGAGHHSPACRSSMSTAPG
jgi:hypothetical protein